MSRPWTRGFRRFGSLWDLDVKCVSCTKKRDKRDGRLDTIRRTVGHAHDPKWCQVSTCRHRRVVYCNLSLSDIRNSTTYCFPPSPLVYAHRPSIFPIHPRSHNNFNKSGVLTFYAHLSSFRTAQIGPYSLNFST